MNNQFGPQDYVIHQRRELCVPSATVTPPQTTTTTTVAEATTTTSTP